MVIQTLSSTDAKLTCLKLVALRNFVGKTVWIADSSYSGLRQRLFFGVYFKPVIIQKLDLVRDFIFCEELSGNCIVVQISRQAVILGEETQ